MGIQEVVRHSSVLIRYVEKDPHKINHQLIRHNLLTQKITINALNAGVIKEYETERMFDEAGDKLGKKRPDVLWITINNLRIGVENELSPKWERDLDSFVLAINLALTAEDNKKARFDRFIVCSDSPAILKNYSLAMQPNAPLNIWEKNQRGHWVVNEKIKVPDWLIEKVDFRKIE